MAERDFDLLIIGGGPAGSGAVETAAKRGVRVGIIERDKPGGTCLNYGCDPTKTMLNMAYVLTKARQGGKYGLKIAQAEVDWEKVQSRLAQIITTIRGGTPEESVRQMRERGIDPIYGEASFKSANELEISGQTYRADSIIIAVGGETSVPPIDGLQRAGYITNREAIYLPKLPKSMAIIGAGSVGIEFAQMFHRFGVQVTVLEAAETLMPQADDELAEMLAELLRAEGIRMEINVDIQRVQSTEQGKKITFKCDEGDVETVTVDEILLATGRHPDLETLNIGAAGLETDKEGALVADDTLRTSVKHIWAAGDVTSKFPFTHIAYEQGILAANNALSKKAQAFKYQAVGWATFTHPTLAQVGETEEALKEQGVEYRVGRKLFNGVVGAITKGETDGLVKLIASPDGTILGGHVLSYEAGEVIAPVVIAMRHGLKAEQLAETILPYPTLASAVRQAAQKLLSEE